MVDKPFPYKALTYKVIGICMKVHNKLGSSYKEVYYQRAIAEELKTQKIPFRREHEVGVYYEDRKIGKHYLDFLINDWVILEIKAKPFLVDKEESQLLAYLKTLRKRVGLLVNFRPEKLQVKRVLLPDKYLFSSV